MYIDVNIVIFLLNDETWVCTNKIIQLIYNYWSLQQGQIVFLIRQIIRNKQRTQILQTIQS